MGRTFAIGDIHGDAAALRALLASLPDLTPADTLVFLGDYLDRGPDSAEVVRIVRALPEQVPARVVTLRGNHEDAWLSAIDAGGWIDFTLPERNGCNDCYRSFTRAAPPLTPEEEFTHFHTGAFFPPDVVAWMRALPHWYEDDFAIYLHAGLIATPDRSGWLHPSEVEDPRGLLWTRSKRFLTSYTGKPVVCGHTGTTTMPPDLSKYTPDDPTDLYWAGGSVYLIDTNAGKGGFLTALEMPSGLVYESRDSVELPD
jgi:serine/threonine protein phosphatase 1